MIQAVQVDVSVMNGAVEESKARLRATETPEVPCLRVDM